MRLPDLRTLFLGIALSCCLVNCYAATAGRTHDAGSVQSSHGSSSDQSSSGSSERKTKDPNESSVSKESSTPRPHNEIVLVIDKNSNILDNAIYIMSSLSDPELKSILDLVKSLPLIGSMVDATVRFADWCRDKLVVFRDSTLAWVIKGALPCEIGMESWIHCSGKKVNKRVKEVISRMIESIPDSVLPYFLKGTAMLMLDDVVDSMLAVLTGSSY